MLERLALATPPQQFSQRRQLRCSELALELEIKVHSRPRQHVPEQVLRVQPRLIDLALAQKLRALLQHLQQGHATDDSFNRSAMSAVCKAVISSFKSPSMMRSRL